MQTQIWEKAQLQPVRIKKYVDLKQSRFWKCNYVLGRTDYIEGYPRSTVKFKER